MVFLVVILLLIRKPWKSFLSSLHPKDTDYTIRTHWHNTNLPLTVSNGKDSAEWLQEKTYYSMWGSTERRKKVASSESKNIKERMEVRMLMLPWDDRWESSNWDKKKKNNAVTRNCLQLSNYPLRDGKKLSMEHIRDYLFYSHIALAHSKALWCKPKSDSIRMENSKHLVVCQGTRHRQPIKMHAYPLKYKMRH